MSSLVLSRFGVLGQRHAAVIVGPPPFIPMDHIADAMVFPEESGSISFDNTGYDADPEVGTIVGHDGWAVFTPNADCMVHLDTISSHGNTVDTHIVVWIGIDTLSPIPPDFYIAGQDDDSGGGGGTSSLTFLAQGGRKHWVQVGMHHTHTPVTDMSFAWSGIDFHSTPVSRTRNDDLAHAQPVDGTGTSARYSNWDYSTESGEPSVFSHDYRSSWFYFRPGSSGDVSLNTEMFTAVSTAGGLTSDTDTFLAVYSSPTSTPTVSDLTLVTSDDDSGGSGTSALTFAATAGVHYFAQVSQYRSTGFNFDAGLAYSIPAALVPTFTDDFHRANGPIGNGWSSLYDTAVISGNKAVCQTEYSTYGRDSGSADADVTGSFIRGTDGASSCYVLARASDADNGFKFGYQANTGQLVCYSTVTGVPTSLVAVGDSIAAGAAFTLRLVIHGTSVKCYRNDILVGTATTPGGSSTGHLVGFQISEPGGIPDACTYFAY